MRDLRSLSLRTFDEISLENSKENSGRANCRKKICVNYNNGHWEISANFLRSFALVTNPLADLDPRGPYPLADFYPPPRIWTP